MRALLTLFIALLAASPALLAASSAQAASRLKLESDRPMVIVVNMVPHTVGTQAPVNIDFPDGKEGTQRITVRNMIGQVVHQGTIVVPANFVVTVAWRDRQLEVVDRKLLKNSGPYNNSAGTKNKQPGHKGLDDLAKTSGEVPVDLLTLAASDASASEEGDTGLGPLANELAVQETAAGTGEPASSGKGTTQSVENKVLAGGDAAGSAIIRLIPQSQSWANVWIGGEKVWEYRGKGDVMEVRLASGVHTVAVKDFRDQSDWGAGSLTIGSDETASVHFSMSQPIEARGGTWAPK